jgi:hypothetical protein
MFLPQIFLPIFFCIWLRRVVERERPASCRRRLPMLMALLDGYADLIKAHEDKEELLNAAREALRAHDRTTDALNKRWYRTVKTGPELSPALTTAARTITIGVPIL